MPSHGVKKMLNASFSLQWNNHFSVRGTPSPQEQEMMICQHSLLFLFLEAPGKSVTMRPHAAASEKKVRSHWARSHVFSVWWRELCKAQGGVG